MPDDSDLETAQSADADAGRVQSLFPETPAPAPEPSLAERRRRGIYLLPNLITTGALFSGFYAVIAAMHGLFENAAVAIYVAGVLDALDGRVARFTRTQSNFGKEFDSLSDVVAFGVAPALVGFSWGLAGLGKLGWMAAFIFVACAALRLARFNAQTDKKAFTGLPSPAAAGLVAALVWVWSDGAAAGETVSRGVSLLAAVVTTAAGLMMVSNVVYYSPKNLPMFKGRVPFGALLVVVLLFAVVFIDPPRVLFACAVAYFFSGPMRAAWVWYCGRRAAAP